VSLAAKPRKAGRPLAAPRNPPSVIQRINTRRMVRLLHRQHSMSDRFIAHMLARNIRIEEDRSISCSIRAKSGSHGRCCCWRYGKHGKPTRAVPAISQALDIDGTRQQLEDVVRGRQAALASRT